ncbi:MAG TPA: alpha/beta fold hydrolase [Gryllotalpicola sp.]
MTPVDARSAARSDGRSIAYDVAGDRATGAPLVVLHAVGLNRGIWSDWAGPLVDAGHYVIAVDLPGHGDSDPEPAAPSLSGMAAGVVAVLDAEGLATAAILGVSMGGMVAQTLAIEWPARTQALVLCCTMATVPDSVRPLLRRRGADAVEGGMAAVVAPTLERWLSPEGRESGVSERIAQALLADDATIFNGCWDAISQLDTVVGLAGVSVPTLVIAGGSDTSLPPNSGETLAAAVPGSTLIVIPGAWHLGAYEQPGPFLAHTREFLAPYSGLSVID